MGQHLPLSRRRWVSATLPSRRSGTRPGIRRVQGHRNGSRNEPPDQLDGRESERPCRRFCAPVCRPETSCRRTQTSDPLPPSNRPILPAPPQDFFLASDFDPVARAQFAHLHLLRIHGSMQKSHSGCSARLGPALKHLAQEVVIQALLPHDNHQNKDVQTKRKSQFEA